MRLHSVNTDDATGLERLLELMRAYYAFDGLAFDPTRAARAVRDMLSSERGLAWLVMDGEAALGYAAIVWSYSLEYGGLSAELDEFYLRPEARGRGLGRAVMTEILQRLRARGAVLLRLETEPENAAARGFYSHLGFRVVEREFMQWVPD